ncbi:hypothetical protein BAE44_0017434 [Dichanthelium oligosanthes]|uniref:BTB domain-containing protein n=1 Tax=Dichanthelium oligosanthes TaxID=888268 RepID=A0A1E5V915_9POAL|nr:hypothetical protein BAE44_0017434 [Dichanthelium oligosanthes]
MTVNANVRAFNDLSLVKQATGLAESVCSETDPRVFNSCNDSRYSRSCLIAKRSKLEPGSAGYVVDDCLTIECSVTVIKESQALETTGVLEIQVPSSDLSEHFGELLLEEEADVTFNVGGETFPAHRMVLATQCPVFKAELYGQMKERRARHVTVEDIQPDVSRPCCNSCTLILFLTGAIFMLMITVRWSGIYLWLQIDVCIEFMASSNHMNAVVETEGYANLKKTCPSILADVLEKTMRRKQDSIPEHCPVT